MENMQTETESTINFETQELLAKLMATENITVEHKAKLSTAAFDVKNRTLYLPSWKNMTKDLYSLLIGHEVGHALNTPKDGSEDIFKNKKHLKSLVNIIEDVRIDKLIQRKFPGLRKSYRIGMNSLLERDFFNIAHKDIAKLGFADRLNIYFKSRYAKDLNVPFDKTEKSFSIDIELCNTFDEVVNVAQRIYDYMKDKAEEQAEQNESEEEYEIEISTDGEGSSEFDGTEMDDSEDSETDSGSGNTGESEENEEEDDEDSEGDGESDSKTEKEEKPNKGKGKKTDKAKAKIEELAKAVEDILNKELESETQTDFDNNLKDLVDETETTYANLPREIDPRFIRGYKETHRNLKNHYSRSHQAEKLKAGCRKFISDNARVVNFMAQQFELKKSATISLRINESKTGVINTNLLHSYRYNENIFNSNINVPKGKSHGMIMFIDLSTSMYDYMSLTFEHVMNLVMFCRKVRIPFDVYGFAGRPDCGAISATGKEPNRGDIAFDSSFKLKHYFSSDMSTSEFNEAFYNIYCLKESYNYRMSNISTPADEHLGNTPLNQTVISARMLIDKFRKHNPVDVLNVIFLTDGDPTDSIAVYNPEAVGAVRGVDYLLRGKVVIRDSVSKKSVVAANTWRANATHALYGILKNTKDINLIGFYVVGGKAGRDVQRALHSIDPDLPYDKYNDVMKKFKEDKFVRLSPKNFDAYYVFNITNKNKPYCDDDFTDGTKNKRAKAFSSMIQTTRGINKFVLGSFIEVISKRII